MLLSPYLMLTAQSYLISIICCVLCISTSKPMLVHAFTWSKAMKSAWKLSKSTFFFIPSRGPSKAHLGLWWKSTFLIIFKRFLLFLTMWMHAQVCVHWSKYTTVVLCISLNLYCKLENQTEKHSKSNRNIYH